MDRFAKQFGERVRLARLESGLTQAQLAAAAHVGPNYVPRIERGEMTPSVDAAFRLAQALGVAVDDLCAPPPRRDPMKEAMRALSVLSENDLAAFRKSLRAIEVARSSLRPGGARRPSARPGSKGLLSPLTNGTVRRASVAARSAPKVSKRAHEGRRRGQGPRRSG
ncbi:MAG TPA: helix-turn-helix domain-containing protein [Polyangiaceae bacterium]|nr:helix-turn-helix domain-containing protein [Polyangiaceae bacterium]